MEGAGGVGGVAAEGDGEIALALDVEGVGGGGAEGLEAGDGAGVGRRGFAGRGLEGGDGQAGAWREMGCVGWGERAESEEACTGGENEKQEREDLWVLEVHVWGGVYWSVPPIANVGRARMGCDCGRKEYTCEQRREMEEATAEG
jgi:hypothetical protein